MKIDRLISIIMVLLEYDQISAPKLAKMFEVSTRTIYRDIDTILLSGIPIVTTSGINGGISIMSDYKIDKKFFTASDISSLLIGLESVSPTLSQKEFSYTIEKVKSLIPKEHFKEIQLKSNQISIDLNSWIINENLSLNLDLVKAALNENRYLSFIYIDRKGNKTKRKVEIYKLILKDGNWYFQAYCTDKNNFRIFKLLRLSTPKLSDDTFTPRELDLEASYKADFMNKRLTTTIKILIDESIIDKVLMYCSFENIRPHKDKYLAELPFFEDEFGYNLLLSFGDKCECLEPQHVRDELINKLQNILDIYNFK